MGGGILPYTIYRNRIYFLFSRECKESMNDPGKWSDFGGGKEKKETPLETAIREGFEESEGFLGDKDEIKKLIENESTKKIQTSNYTSYIIYIPYDKELPKKFRKNKQKWKI